MKFHTFRDRILYPVSIRVRLHIVFLWYLLSIMTDTRKHSLTYASELSGMGKSSFSRFLKNNYNIPAYTIGDLSKKTAKKFSKILKNSRIASVEDIHYN